MCLIMKLRSIYTVQMVKLTVNVINACFLWAFLKVIFKTIEVRILLIQSVVADFKVLI